jgi:hypothetical protein
MPYHGPGWTVDTETTAYMLWAPQPEPTLGGNQRDHWAANWSRGRGTYDNWEQIDGDHRQGNSAVEALDCFPTDDTEARRARTVLLRAADGWYPKP